MKKGRFIQPLTPSKKLVDGTVYYFSDAIANKLNEVIEFWNVRESQERKEKNDTDNSSGH